ncbi:hypothetical protein D3OALGA1CA_370 [Olavius algarvensis associated proteobacterium Delta 3]|nr:hypothetical protein D3OALGA1CA_370 [Olavius algarvensis associated proteobacterium Delta 3]CAB5100990.1 hypothetical protein D3OALGB2SA_1836 [Olavius algarvensis associated proteobacterium Delta 3]
MAKFKAITFKGKKTAMKALHTLEDYSPEYYWIDDVAVVSRSKHGHLRVNSTWAQDESGKAGLGWGAVAGGLIGMLAGPGGALAGAAVGGGMGGLLGAAEDVAFDDPRLDDLAAALDKDTSALIMVADEAELADFWTAVEPFGGEVIDTDLDEKDIKALKKALKS